MSNITRTTLTAREAAEYLGISYWFVTMLVKRRQLPCIRLGNRLLFRVETLQEYLQQQEKQSVAPEESTEGYGKIRRIKL